MLLPTHNKQTVPVNFSALKNIVLIGGGDLMAASAKIFHTLGFNVTIVAATRHINEQLVLNNETFSQACQPYAIAQHTISDINQLSKQQLNDIIPEDAMAICFGPAWVFNKQIIQTFHYGMFNINAIPIPHYLGGAHYTWQLLNNNRDGGCFFQQITAQVDQGDIFAKHQFSISQQASTPHEYFVENIKQGVIFIEELAQMFIQGVTFSPTAYAPLNDDRLYLPRLRTDKQGYINWQWSAADIVSFCQGFDSPYLGVASFIADKKLRFKQMKQVNLTDNNHNAIAAMHPFCSGLIVRKVKQANNTTIIVAAQNGFIELGDVIDEQGVCVKASLKEGMRLHTPQKLLDEALAYQVVIDGSGFKD
ncbi:MAG: hypothetical protein OQK09_06435 [Colwellia sp.]|nr:hypothetical protein [Colwellia sp.]MCW8863852.1 hypothetical protein [Colwellia sp.]MCW9081134.1 hypothetical protein [Colwellia sp.]